MHPAARFGGGYPPGDPGAGGDASVKRCGELEQGIRKISCLPESEVLDEIQAFLQSDAGFNHKPSGTQNFRAAGSIGVGVGSACHNVTYACGQDRFGARRSFAVVTAGLERDDQSALGRINSFFLRVIQRFHFGVRHSGFLVAPHGHNNAFLHKQRADAGIGTGLPSGCFGQSDSL